MWILVRICVMIPYLGNKTKPKKCSKWWWILLKKILDKGFIINDCVIWLDVGHKFHSLGIASV